MSGVLWSGGVHNTTDGSACCDLDAANCKVQSIGSTLDWILDATQEAWLQTNGVQGIMYLYNEKKQLDVVPSNTSGWHCVGYCHVGKYEWAGGPLEFDNATVYDGKVTVDGKSLDKYHWDEGIGKLIKMEEVDFFVDPSGAYPVPIQQLIKLTPFNGPEVSESINLFNNFAKGTPPASTFKVDNLDSCPKNDKDDCDDSSSYAAKMRLLSKISRKASFLEKAKIVAKETNIRSQENAAAKTNYSWPSDYSARTTSLMAINQGGVRSGDGVSLCCDRTYNGQCQVQVQYVAGQLYHDYSNKRLRYEYDDGETIFNDYKA